MSKITSFDPDNIPMGMTVEEAARAATPPNFSHVPDTIPSAPGYWVRSATSQGFDVDAQAYLYPNQEVPGLWYSVYDQPSELTAEEMRHYIADLVAWWHAEEMHLVRQQLND